MRLRRKITVAFFLVSALVSLLLALFLYRFVERQLRAELRNRLRNIATLGARTIDPAAYDRLVPDRNTPVRIGASHVTATEIDVVTSYADFIRFPDAHTVFEDVPLGIYPTAVRRVQALTREL